MVEPDLLVQSILVACVAAIGASIGSFLNVCIYRIPIGLTVTRPRRSFCPFCRTQIRATDNIPVVSWLLLRGRCRSCHAPIPVWYFLVELFAGTGAGLSYWKSGFTGAALFLMVYSLLTYALRTSRAGHYTKPRFLAFMIVLAVVLYFQRETAPGNHPWKLAVCCLSALVILRSGYTVSIHTWTQRTVIFGLALASGWLGALLAATILMLYRNRSPDTKDAILLACLSMGSFLA